MVVKKIFRVFLNKNAAMREPIIIQFCKPLVFVFSAKENKTVRTEILLYDEIYLKIFMYMILNKILLFLYWFNNQPLFYAHNFMS